MRGSLVAVVALGAAHLACGGGVREDADPLPNSDAGADVRLPSRDGGRPPRDASVEGGLTPQPDPVCPDPPPAQADFRCDVLAQKGCDAGEACYPFIDYPGFYCEAERYGAECAKAGLARSGVPCETSSYCAPGLVCVITGAGTHCAATCDLQKAAGCPEGYVCQSLDVTGLGVCQ